MTLTSISNVLHDCLFNINVVQWSQATLPVKTGGSGLRSYVKLGLSKFLALQLQNSQRNYPALLNTRWLKTLMGN